MPGFRERANYSSLLSHSKTRQEIPQNTDLQLFEILQEGQETGDTN